MNESDHKAFEEWFEKQDYGNPEHPMTVLSKKILKVQLLGAYLAALAHRDKQFAELVEAVDELMSQVKTHSASSSVGTGPMHAATITDLSLLVKLKKLAAKLKEQQ